MPFKLKIHSFQPVMRCWQCSGIPESRVLKKLPKIIGERRKALGAPVDAHASSDEKFDARKGE